MKIGIYYPPGHSVLERAVQNFRQNLAKVAGDNPYIRFSVRDGNLYLQDILVDTRHFFTKEFQETLSSLTIRHLDIDREILPEEIRKFIQSLIVYRAKYKATKGFAQINLEELPFSVRISQAEYLAPEVDTPDVDTPADAATPTLEALLESLKGQDLNSKQLNQCRHLLENISLQTLPALTDGNTLSPLITWADVERLIVNLVKKSETTDNTVSTKSRQDLNALASILNTIGEKTTSKSSREAIDLLVSLVKKNTDDQSSDFADSATRPKADDLPDPTKIEAIERYLVEHQALRPKPKQLLRNDRCEALTIALLLLQYKHPLQVQYRLQQILREILASEMNKNEWRVLANGGLMLLNTEDREQLTVIMAMIIDPLRRSEHSSSLSLYEQVSGKCDHEQLKKLLPYIVNELLVVGRQENPKAFDKLCKKIRYLPTSDIHASYPVLCKLDAFGEDRVAQNLFFSLPKENFPVFAPLINTTLEKTLSKRIFHAFRNSAPDWLIEALLPFLRASTTLNRQFFFEYLKESGNPEASPKLRSLAGKIVAVGLPALSEENRQSLTLIKTIKAVPRLTDARLRPVLESIISKRHLLIIPQWPPHCRKAAREALSAMAKSRR